LQFGMDVAAVVGIFRCELGFSQLKSRFAHGWRVPTDIGLIGMDHTPLSQVTSPRLTTVGYDLAAVAQNTLAAALGALSREDAPPFTNIDLRVIPGESA
jgi:DNA-binding LacI/PurR family transcriptional regulator